MKPETKEFKMGAKQERERIISMLSNMIENSFPGEGRGALKMVKEKLENIK